MVARLANQLNKLGQAGFERPLVAPSLLAADFADLKNELARVSNADLLHLDIMDGEFVPDISFGTPVIKAVEKNTELPLDLHLMINNPQTYLPIAYKLKPQVITIPFETGGHLHRILMNIKEAGVLAGLALNPGTSFESVIALLSYVDLVLVMSVDPGYGGQSFIPEVLPKIRLLDRYRISQAKRFFISVDGGVNEKNAGVIVQAGADILVAGSAVFGQRDAHSAIIKLKEAGKSRL